MNKSKIKVLHVLNELKPSGAETMYRIAAPFFTDYGVEAEIVSTGSKIGSYAGKLAEAGFKLHHIPFTKSPSFFYKLFLLMQKGNYHVIHLHTARAGFWYGLIALVQFQSVVLQTIHNSFEFTGNLRLKRMFQRRILSFLGVQFISISPSVQATELKHFGLKTNLILNWYDSRSFRPPTESQRSLARERLGISPSDKVIITVGNCSKVKNHGALIEAISLLPKNEQPIYLHVGIEEENQPERQLAKSLGLNDKIHFIGPLSNIMPALYAADIFVMPSLFEGFGIAAVEAIATGCPVILSDVAGLRDFKSNFDGIIYTETDALSLSHALHKLLTESTEDLRSRTKDYHLICKEKFGVETGVAQYMKLYKKNYT